MHRCDVCDRISNPRESVTRIPIEFREKKYPSRPEANDTGGVGQEIVREINVCTDCVKKGNHVIHDSASSS